MPVDADVIDLLKSLIAIDSVNPGLVPEAGGERRIAEFLQERLAAHDFTTRIVEAEGHPDRPSLLAWTGDVGDGALTVLLNGHLDTVGAGGMEQPFLPRAEGDHLVGRGTCDMKGGVAGIVVAAETLARTDPDIHVVLALVADEEDRSLGTEAVLRALEAETLRPTVALVAEPTWLDLATSHRGYAVVEILFEGRAAHSSQPADGVNAATHLGRLIVAVESANAEIADRGGSFMVTVADAGTSPFVIPDRARAIVERRTVPGERSEDALAEVERILENFRQQDPDVRARARLLHARTPWQLATTGIAATFADELRRALRATERDCGEMTAPYWMESALWQEAGIPTVVCGPAGGGLHADDEWVSISQVEDFTTALVATIRALAKDPQ